MRLTVTLLIAAFISGCASYNTDLVNSEGAHTKCAVWGVGWLGAPVAMAEHHNCMQKAEAAGYHEAGEPTATAQPATASK